MTDLKAFAHILLRQKGVYAEATRAMTLILLLASIATALDISNIYMHLWWIIIAPFQQRLARMSPQP